MEFLIVIGVIGIAMLMNKYMGTKPIENKDKPCDFHKWVKKNNNDNEYLVCELCKLIPGTDVKDFTD